VIEESPFKKAFDREKVNQPTNELSDPSTRRFSVRSTRPSGVRYVTKEEVERFFAAIPKQSIRDRLLFDLIYHHGLRRREVALISIDDISLRDGSIWISRVKQGILGAYQLHPQTLALLRAYLPTRDAGAARFPLSEHASSRCGDLALAHLLPVPPIRDSGESARGATARARLSAQHRRALHERRRGFSGREGLAWAPQHLLHDDLRPSDKQASRRHLPACARVEGDSEDLMALTLFSKSVNALRLDRRRVSRADDDCSALVLSANASHDGEDASRVS
jgi:integrase